jgi:hypothetical protein
MHGVLKQGQPMPIRISIARLMPGNFQTEIAARISRYGRVSVLVEGKAEGGRVKPDKQHLDFGLVRVSECYCC